tara:strand:- start:332 stop:1312 length:981 start_codon:yes stop_codon:yes gene_type:complete
MASVVASLPAFRPDTRRRVQCRASQDDDIRVNPSIGDERRGGRRALLAATGAASLGLIDLNGKGTAVHNPQWSCRCGGCALAMAPLIDVDPGLRSTYDLPRSDKQDYLFAKGMAQGMTGYEMAVKERKQRLFADVFARLPKGAEATVVEVGLGTFPNASYYFESKGGPSSLDLVGVDPNDKMKAFATDNLAKARVAGSELDASLRIVHGVAEALPLPSKSADAVICTLTLCSVLDPERAVAEIKRVLKPGAPFMFIEHVLSEDDPNLAQLQLRFNSMQIAMADGCHLDRKTLDVIKSAGFGSVEAERFSLPGFGLISSQVAGIAVA